MGNWLISALQHVLPANIAWNQDKFALEGHSRGGKMAFALALEYTKTPLKVNISALVGLDPVEGSKLGCLIDPKILTYVPHSFNLSIPTTVIGTGLVINRYARCVLIVL